MVQGEFDKVGGSLVLKQEKTQLSTANSEVLELPAT